MSKQHVSLLDVVLLREKFKGRQMAPARAYSGQSVRKVMVTGYRGESLPNTKRVPFLPLEQSKPIK